MTDERLAIDDSARDLVQRHAVLVEQVAALLGSRLRGEPVRGVRIERGEPEGEGLVFRVLYEGEVEEAQHLWERLEQDLSELQQRMPGDGRATISERIAVVVEW